MPIKTEELINNITFKLEEIIFLLKITNEELISDYLSKSFDTEEKRKVFMLTDGINSIQNILDKTGIKSKSTVSNYWDEWQKRGFLKDSAAFKGRKQRLIDLGFYPISEEEKNHG